MTKQCLCCEKPFQRKKRESHKQFEGRKFCSRVCLFTRRRRSKQEFSCQECEKRYVEDISQKRRFCSMVCKNIVQSRVNVGEKNPFFGRKHTRESIEQMLNSSEGNGNIGNSKYFNETAETTRRRISWTKNKRNRVLKRLQLEGATHSFQEWELLRKQYGFTCPCCLLAEPEIKLSEDHIVPLSKGGTDLIENIQPLCLKCNFKKHTKTIKYKICV